MYRAPKTKWSLTNDIVSMSVKRFHGNELLEQLIVHLAEHRPASEDKVGQRDDRDDASPVKWVHGELHVDRAVLAGHVYEHEAVDHRRYD
jgi:hypothetical protein